MKNFTLSLVFAFGFAFALPMIGFAATGESDGGAEIPSSFQGEVDVNFDNPASGAADTAASSFAGIPGGDLLLWIGAGILFLILLGVIIGMASGRNRDERVVKERVVRDV